MEGARGREAGRGGVGRGLGAKGVHLCMFASSVLCVCVCHVYRVCVCVMCVFRHAYFKKELCQRQSPVSVHACVCVFVLVRVAWMRGCLHT